MLRALRLLVTVAQTTARANNAPVCAIGLKKGARVRLPGGARRASQALQIRVRKQLPIPIIPGAHVATLKNCREDVGAFRQTCCALPAALPFVHNGTEPFNTTAVAGHRSTSASAGPSTGRMTTRGCRLTWRRASPPSSGPTTTRSSRSLVEGSLGVINTQ